jgi:hypothetical protein
MEALELVKKNSSILEVISQVQEEAALFEDPVENEISAEQQMKMADSLRSRDYLKKFFSELQVDFLSCSRKEIETTFKLAKEFRKESELFKLYIET